MRKNVIQANPWAKTKKFEQLKKDMLEDLETRGLVGRQYTDKVEEYMHLWCWLQMLNEDVVERGVFLEYSNGATQKGTTDNKSLTIATRVSAQMLSIWTALGFREQATSTKLPPGGEEDVL